MTMPHEAGEELLEYETEQEETGPLPIEPILVHAVEPVITVPTVAQHITCRTIVLDANTPWAQLLPQDPLRVRARIFTITNGVVICHSVSQAQDLNNTTDQTFATPNGCLISSGVSAIIEGTQQLFVATSKFPTRVGLIIERRSA
jgi:hypothetical protein